MALQVENICKSFGADVILQDVSLTASDNEKVGIIGPNGAGKSTLLKIIAGELSSDSGRIITPKGGAVGFLRQNVSALENRTIWEYMMSAFDDVIALKKEIEVLEEKLSHPSQSDEYNRAVRLYGEKSDLFEKRGGFEMNTRINTVLNGMGFGDFDRNMKASNLSGGEKTKLSMANLLLENPAVLLLDEPTNHLDFKTMQWLEGYLKGYRGIVLAVSHDRYFLDTFSDCIYEIDAAGATRYTGNYSSYLVTKKQNEEIQLKHYNEQQDEIKRLEEYVAKNGVRASTAKSAKSKQKAIDRMTLIDKPSMFKRACRFSFESIYRSYNDVLSVENVSLSVPKSGILEKISENISFEVKRGEKVAVIGANGAGKSTLLKTILGEHKYYDGNIEIGRNVKLSYYDQEQKHLVDGKTVFDTVSDRFPLMDESVIRTHLGSVLFKDDDVFKLVRDLSGGERARLMFLLIMLEKANFLVLDEPTNHLDLPAKESLDTAVSDYDGTVLFVSHDRYFLNKTADKILELTENGISEYNGNYDDYLAAKSGVSARAPKSASNESRSLSYEEEKRAQANIRNTERKIADTEKKIADTEEKITQIDASLETCGADFEKARELFDEKGGLENELNSLYEQWNELTEKLEIIKKWHFLKFFQKSC